MRRLQFIRAPREKNIGISQQMFVSIISNVVYCMVTGKKETEILKSLIRTAAQFRLLVISLAWHVNLILCPVINPT